MHNEKSYFGTQNGSLATRHIGVVTTEQYEPAQWPIQCGRSTVDWHRPKSNESFIHFLWSEGVKPSEIYRRMKVQYGDSCVTVTCLDL